MASSHAFAARLGGTVLEREEPRTGGPRGPEAPPPSGDGGGDSSPERRRLAAATGILLVLAAVTMFFMALTSAFLVRKGTGGDWVPLRLPAILWANTAILVISSAFLEVARRREKRGWLHLATVLGLAFLAGQLVAWKDLAAQGVYVWTNPGASFFYVLTAAHGVHLAGGVAALLYAGTARARENALRVAATYWHFMGVLWIYLLLLLRFGG
jgi:cytochrome c oxidase subunit 3